MVGQTDCNVLRGSEMQKKSAIQLKPGTLSHREEEKSPGGNILVLQ